MNKIIKENFNLEIIELKKLDGYENENYLITTKNKKYLKIIHLNIFQRIGTDCVISTDSNNQIALPAWS